VGEIAGACSSHEYVHVFGIESKRQSGSERKRKQALHKEKTLLHEQGFFLIFSWSIIFE